MPAALSWHFGNVGMTSESVRTSAAVNLNKVEGDSRDHGRADRCRGENTGHGRRHFKNQRRPAFEPDQNLFEIIRPAVHGRGRNQKRWYVSGGPFSDGSGSPSPGGLLF